MDGENNTKLGGGFKYFLCSSLLGEDSHVDEHIFQMGWNHQLENPIRVDDLGGFLPPICGSTSNCLPAILELFKGSGAGDPKPPGEGHACKWLLGCVALVLRINGLFHPYKSRL